MATNSRTSAAPVDTKSWRARRFPGLIALVASQSRSADATERENTARARCLEVLAASLVHELNQSLSTITLEADTCLRLLSADTPDIEAARETTRRTIHDGKRAAAAVQRLWSLFAKTQASSEAVDLNQTAREALVLSAHELQRHGVIVRPELEVALPQVTGDSAQLQQVILSLVVNAAEAMNQVDDRPRELVVSTHKGPGHVRLTVRDAGEGFNPRETDRLFDAFYTTKSDGMGIGLFISRWIIESHGGAIYAVLNDGPGATFSFQIPRREA